MANVTRCDVCGDIVEHKDARYVKLYHENDKGTLGKIIDTVEICDKCYKGVATMLKLEEKNNGTC